MLRISRPPQFNGNKMIQPTRQNAIVFTIYSALISTALLVLNDFLPDQPAFSLTKNLEEANYSNLFFLGAVGLWFFFAGLVIIALYFFFFSRRIYLERPKSLFLIFYIIFIIWLAIFVSTNLFFSLLSFFFPLSVSENMVMTINLVITFLIDFLGLCLFYHYISQTKFSFKELIRWTGQLIKGDSPYFLKQLVCWGIFGYIGFYPILLIVTALYNFLLGLTGKEFSLQAVVQFSAQNKNPLMTILILISAVILAPVFEEILMRGLVFRGLILKLSNFWAMILSGATFGLFHFNVASFLPITILGALFAWLYLRTGSLIPCIIAHAVFNGLNFLLLRLLLDFAIK
jgi:membrane protease YdiL (CAAX protease family)